MSVLTFKISGSGRRKGSEPHKRRTGVRKSKESNILSRSGIRKKDRIVYKN